MARVWSHWMEVPSKGRNLRRHHHPCRGLAPFRWSDGSGQMITSSGTKKPGHHTRPMRRWTCLSADVSRARGQRDENRFAAVLTTSALNTNRFSLRQTDPAVAADMGPRPAPESSRTECTSNTSVTPVDSAWIDTNLGFLLPREKKLAAVQSTRPITLIWLLASLMTEESVVLSAPNGLAPLDGRLMRLNFQRHHRGGDGCTDVPNDAMAATEWAMPTSRCCSLKS